VVLQSKNAKLFSIPNASVLQNSGCVSILFQKEVLHVHILHSRQIQSKL